MKIKNYTFLILLSFLSACFNNVSPVAPNPEQVDFPQLAGTPPVVSNNPVTYFNNQIKSQGINLTKEDTNTLKEYLQIRSEGKWAYSETGSSKDTLQSNFESFKDTFNSNVPKDEFEYMNRAIQFANSGNFYAKLYFDTTFYKERKKVLVIKWDTQTKEFIIIHIDGRISNYQFAENINPPRYIMVPESL